MGTYFELILREGALLLLLTALGSGPAAWCRPDPAYGSRLALAPAFGLAVGAVLSTTALEFTGIGTAAWVVIVPAAVISLVAAALRLRAQRPRLERGLARQVLALLALVLVVASVVDVPMAERDSLGPIAYRA
ncbi:MAG TPA: hypothetical protein VK279_05855, partial [Solirubrobacteraceae bacterium]|nr:hypothetical protein [Solirubrobacteraceae bacterium]